MAFENIFSLRNDSNQRLNFDQIFGKNREETCRDFLVSCSDEKLDLSTNLSPCMHYKATVLRTKKDGLKRILLDSIPSFFTSGRKKFH